MSESRRSVDLFVDKVIDLCREHGFCLLPSDPFVGLNVVPFSEDDLDYLFEIKRSPLSF